MLNQFRQFSGTVGSKLLLAFLIMTFAVWGVGDMVRSPGGKGVVASVGDESIHVRSYQRALHQQTERLRQAFGDKFSPELLKNLNLEQQVLQSLVQDALLKQESKALQLVPGDSDIARRIRNGPTYQDGKGGFDKVRFQAMLRSNGISEKNYIEQQRSEMATAMLVNALNSANPLPAGAAEALYQAREERREATIYRLSPSLVADLPEPTQAELEAFHKDHAAQFTLPEYRSISYVVIKNDAVKKKAPSEAELKQAYEERQDDFRHPERRHVEQLLFSSEEKAKAADGKLKSGKDFTAVAKESDILNSDSVSLGKIQREHVIDAAQEAVFSIKEGETTEPIKSSFGWHIFRVKSIEPSSVTPFAEVRAKLEKELAQHDADDALNKLANTLEDSLAGGSTLKEAASELGLKVQTVPAITAEGKTSDGTASSAIPDLEHFVETAFKTDEKAESSLITSKGGASYILRVDSVTSEKLRPLAEVKDAVAAGWKKTERIKRLEKLAGEVVEMLADKSKREAVLDKYNLSPAYSGEIKRTSHGTEEFAWPVALSQDVFSHKPGETTDAHLLKSGDYAVAVAGESTGGKAPADKEKIDVIRGELQMHVQSELFAEYLNYLIGQYPVTVNQGLLKPAEE